MSKTKWTPAQQAAIDDRGGALLVSAAAGSGKTAVLTERVVQLITDAEHPVNADRLLIVTFTNAAAAELRARIAQALLERIQQEPGNAALRRQRMLLQRASICTIDAFCMDLLRKNFQALDIPPDFTPADAGVIEVLMEQALSETLEKAYGDPDFCAFADLYGKGRTDRTAEQVIRSIYRFLRALPDYNRRLDEMLTPWKKENGFDSTCWHDLLLEQTAEKARAGYELLDAAVKDAQEDWADARAQADNGKKSAAKAIAKINENYTELMTDLKSFAAVMRSIEQCAVAGRWTALYDKLTPYALEMIPDPGPKKGKRLPKGDHQKATKARLDAARDLFGEVKGLISCSEEEAEKDRQMALPRLRALFAAVRDFDTRFSAKKREKKMLEFSDFEHEAWRLLCNADGTPTELCRSIRQNYDAVMVDEYQDTNALQDAIYRCLASPSGDNLFLVGDLKQSIYRFRQADPTIFKEKLDTWDPMPQPAARACTQAGTTGENARIALDANFRSAPQVVEGINYIFERLMTPQLGDTAYGDGQRLVCGAPSDYEGSVEAQFLQKEDAKSSAEWVAQRIRQMVEGGEQVRAGASTRPLQYEDCCVLLPTRSNFQVYVEAMISLGIPVYADTRDDLFQAPHIRPLISLIRVLDNPAQDIYLASAMLGPVFGFTDDDLVRLRAKCAEVAAAADETGEKSSARRASLYGALLMIVNSDAVDPFAQKLRGFYGQLTRLRNMARSVPMEQLIEEIFATTGYLAVIGTMENGARRREDVHRFVSFCASSGANGISALVRALDAAALAGDKMVDAAPGGARPGCVTIMTIHRSKGLQFPVVFLSDTGRRFNESDLHQPILMHHKYGVGLRLRPEQGAGTYKTAAYTALSCVHARELRSEQMRLLYVALTRAQDKLILVVPLGMGSNSNPLAKAAAFLSSGADKTLNLRAASFAEWLRTALLVHPCGGGLRQLAENLELPFVDTKSVIDIAIQQDELPQEDARQEQVEHENIAADPALTQKIREGFVWRYPAAELADVPAKVSVTSVVHKTEQTMLERPAFLSKDGLTAAEMGTAVHSFIEHADFDVLSKASAQGDAALQAAICAERDRQAAAKLTTPEVAARLDTACICRFVHSDAFAKICTADQVLRELPFITSMPARQVMQAQGMDLTDENADAQVLVQGVADLLLVYEDHLELLDYKTDHRKTEADFRRSYHAQLELYASAINKRFAPKRVTYKALYSFALNKLIEIKDNEAARE